MKIHHQIVTKMRITIKKLQGGECMLDILPTTTITEIKDQVCEKLGIPVQEQKLLLFGRTLADDKTVEGYPTIKEGSKINLVVKKPEGPAVKSEGPATKPEEPARKSKGAAKKPKELVEKHIEQSKKPEELAEKPKRPAKKPEELAEKPKGPAKKPEGLAENPKGLYEESIKYFKKQGMSDIDATNTAIKLLRIIEDKFNQMSWDDIDKLCLDCVMDECGLSLAPEKDADCEDTL